MKTKYLILSLCTLLFPAVALAVPVNLSTLAPPSNPQCELFGTDPTFNNGNPWDGKGGPMTVAVGDTITVSMVVSGGTFTGPNIISINDANPPQYSVALPIQVTSTAPGTWSLQFVTPGCAGGNLTIVTH